MTITPMPHSSQFLFQLPTDAFGSPALINPGQEPGQQTPDDGSNLPSKGTATLMAALREFDAALPGYIEAREFYDGDVGDSFASEKIRHLLAKSGVDVVDDLNYAKVPVNAIVNKLRVRAVSCSAGDDANVAEDDESAETETDDSNNASDAGQTGAAKVIGANSDDQKTAADAAKKKIAERCQEKIDKLRKRNQLDIEEVELLLRASEYGDAYMFVWPVVKAPANDFEAYEGAVELDEDNTGTVVGVDMFVNGPDTVRMFYDPENQLRATHVLKTWAWIDPDLDIERERATLYFIDRIERWVTKPEEGTDRSKPESWEPYVVDGQQWPAPNPYKRLPFFHFRNRRPYGRPEHADAYGPQRLITKLVGAHAVTIDYQSFPQRYALSNPKLDDVLGNFINPDNPEDDDDDPEGHGHSQLRADPSAVWRLPGITSVGQFQPADPSVFMNPLDRYIKAIAELTDTPLDRFTGYSTPPSGESRRAANETLYDKADNRRTSYGGVMEDAYEFALELLGESDIDVTVNWAPMDSAIGTEDWSVVGMKIANGVPVKQVLMEAGYPEDEVEKWLSDETGADLMRRVMLLNSIGTAVQTIGAGVALGVVDPEQVGGIIAKILGATGEALPVLDTPVKLRPVQENAAAMGQMGQAGAQAAMASRTNSSSGSGSDSGSGSSGAPSGGGAPAPMPPLPPPPPPVPVGHQ